MTIYRLPDESIFPPPQHADPNGLLAIGGDLSPQRLLLAYSMGIFPWFNEGEPILWWSPDPRFVLEFENLHISRSLGKTLRRETFQVTFDGAFRQVVAACAEEHRNGRGGTWISEGMAAAYGRLHDMGFAHSVECWVGGELVGGLYGVCMGRCFFGESMFHRVPDASKVAFVHLARRLMERGFVLLDCQMPTPHLASMGAGGIPRALFLERLRKGGVTPTAMPQPALFP